MHNLVEEWVQEEGHELGIIVGQILGVSESKSLETPKKNVNM